MSWPFDEWLKIAVRRFGLSPSEFWQMPLREWLLLMETTRMAGCGRAEFDALMAQFPDETGGPDDPE